MAEEKKSSGPSASRAGLGLLTGVLASYVCPLATPLANLVGSVAYTGIAAIANKLFDGKEKTTPRTSLAEGASHFVGRTLGDILRHTAGYYAPALAYIR
jgi:hypothetical protein